MRWETVPARLGACERPGRTLPASSPLLVNHLLVRSPEGDFRGQVLAKFSAVSPTHQVVIPKEILIISAAVRNSVDSSLGFQREKWHCVHFVNDQTKQDLTGPHQTLTPKKLTP